MPGVDQQPEPDEDGLGAHLRGAIIDHARDLVCAFRSDGTILFVNEALTEFLGWPPEQILGTNITDVLHPDDLERAFMAVGVAVEHRPRLTPAAFQLLHRDGHWVRMEVNGGVLAPQFPDVMAVIGRVSHDADLYSAVLERLIAGEPMSVLMATVPHFAIWRNDDTLCAITWTEDSGARCSVGSTLPPLLTGVQAPTEGTSPWLTASATGDEVVHHDLEGLPPSLRKAAEEHGLLGVWVIPIADPSGADPAYITLWSAHESAPVVLATYPAGIAKQLVTIILRWRHQQRELEHAANHDSLTGLTNRAAFFEVLDASRNPDGGDALLYIDLDGFKPVNDRFGHATGDRVLTELADRLREAVRPSDVVGRLGGDEFAVLLRRCRSEEIQTIAHRIRERLGAPIEVDGHRVVLSASIGVASGEVGETLLEAADRAQLDAKKGGGNRVRWANQSRM